MRKRACAGSLVAVACLALSGCAATGATPARSADPSPRTPAVVVADVLQLSGTKEGAQSLESMLRRVVTTLSGADTFRDPHVVTPIVEDVITAKRVYAAIAAHFEARYDADRFDRLVTLLRDPLIRRMTALEVASMAVAPETIAAWKKTHVATADGRARFALARRIDAAAGTTEASMGVLYAAGRGVVRAFSDTARPGQRPPLDRLRAEMEKLEPETREEMIATLAHTYRDATLNEITRYAETLETELARWFSRLQGDAVSRASETLAESAIRRLMIVRRAPRV